MKKKFIAVSMVLGALALSSTTLTSCVDDNESASVTAIRDAKAQQLTALANYQQAQADAEKVIAEAEAAIKNAIAEAKKIENESSSVDLEIKKATLATDIETATAKAEANLLTQQALLAQAKAELLKVEDAVDLMTKEKIKNLIAAADAIMNGGYYYVYETDIHYNSYTGQWETSTIDAQKEVKANESLMGIDPNTGEQVGLKYELIKKKAAKANAEYDLTDTKLAIAEYVRKKNIELATDEALLAEYQKYSNTDKETAQKAADEAKAKLNALQQTLDQAEATEKAEAPKINTAYTAIKATEVEKFLANHPEYEKKYDDYGQPITPVVTREAPEAETVTVTYDDGTTGDATPNYTWIGQYHNSGSKITDSEGTKQIVVNEEELAKRVTSATRTLEVAQAEYDADVKAQTEGLKDDAVISEAPGFNASSFNNPGGLDLTTATYEDLKDATADAQKAYGKDQTQANRTALEAAEADEATYVAYFDVDDSALERAKEAKAAIDELNTLLTGDAFKAYTTAYEAYIAAHDANVTFATATLKAQHNYVVQNALATTLQNVANGYTDWASLINGKEKAINTAKKKIANMTDTGKVVGETGEGATEASRQAYIDALDAEITRLEKEISIKESMYKYYMDQVEALIQGEEAPAPETPAEGEETPAE